MKHPDSYGVMAEFATPETLLVASRTARERGYRDLEAFSPYSIDGLAEVVGFRRNRVPLLTLLGGIAGGVGGYFMQWYSAVVDYPINSGGRPFHSWPAFVPATFELTVLGAALAGFFGMLILNGLPRLHHPVFDAPEFDLASRNRFFLCIRSQDDRFIRGEVHAFLQSLNPIRVVDIAR